MTGESLPVDKSPGDEVFAGTINRAAALENPCHGPASDSTLAPSSTPLSRPVFPCAHAAFRGSLCRRLHARGVRPAAVAVALLAPWLMGLTWMQAAYKAPGAAGHRLPLRLVISAPSPSSWRFWPLGRGRRHPDQRWCTWKARKIRSRGAGQDRHHHRRQAQAGGLRARGLGLGQQALEAGQNLAARSGSSSVQGHRRWRVVRHAKVDEFQAVAGAACRGDRRPIPMCWLTTAGLEERGRCSADLEARLAVRMSKLAAPSRCWPAANGS